jgi:hypothetical protein
VCLLATLSERDATNKRDEDAERRNSAARATASAAMPASVAFRRLRLRRQYLRTVHDGQYVYVLLPNPLDDPIGPFDNFADVRRPILCHHSS